MSDLVLSPLVNTFVAVGKKLFIVGLLALIMLQAFPLEGFAKLLQVENDTNLGIQYFPLDEESSENETKEGESEEDTSKIKKIESTSEINTVDFDSLSAIKKNISLKTIGATKDFYPEMIIPPPNELI